MKPGMTTETEMREHLLRRAAEDAGFRRELVDDPRKTVEREFGVTIPEGIRLSVHEETESDFHLRLPPDPERPSPADLAAAAGGHTGSASTGWA